MIEDDIDDVVAVQGPRLAENRLFSIIVFFIVHDEVEIFVVPSRERPRCFPDVPLGVITHTHREEFHDLPSEIFIRGALDVHAGVEERQHGGVLRNGQQQGPEVVCAVPIGQVEHAKRLAVISNLAFGDCEMTVPEQSHFLFERAIRPNHPVRPPVGDTVGFENACTEPVEELVDDRLQPPITRRLDLDSQGLSGFFCEFGRGWPAGGEWLEAGIVDTRMVERFQMRVVDGLEVDEVADRLYRSHRSQLFDLCRCPAEPRPFEQVSGPVIIPIYRYNRSEIVRPSVLGHRSTRDHHHQRDRQTCPGYSSHTHPTLLPMDPLAGMKSNLL